jgi:hypothetical protein
MVFCYSGISKLSYLSFKKVSILTTTISITYRNHYTTNYTEYQSYLYSRIKGYKECKVSGIGYRKISNILNAEGLKTPMGKTFKQNHIFSIYKKGQIREDRLKSEIIVDRKLDIETYTNDEVDIIIL